MLKFWVYWSLLLCLKYLYSPDSSYGSKIHTFWVTSFPFFFRGLPCLLAGYVIAKICHDDIKQRTISLTVLFCLIIGMQLYSMIVLYQGSVWWLIQGAIGQAIGLFMFRSDPDL